MSIAALILAVAVAFPLLIFLLQDRLIFHPQPLADTQRAEIRKRFPAVEEVFLDSESRKLHAWHVTGAPGAPLVLYFGGNAEEVSWMIEDARARVPGVGRDVGDRLRVRSCLGTHDDRSDRSYRTG